MIGQLPKELNINGVKRAIRSDFRVALLIFQAWNDPELTEQEKSIVMLDCLYEDLETATEEDYQTLLEQAVCFLNGGEDSQQQKQPKKTMDWEQDEKLIFSAVNKVANIETRAVEYLHWWTFLSYFNEIGEGLFTTVLNIRSKQNKGKKLDKAEKDFYRENKSLIDLKHKYSAEEQAEIDKLNELLNS
ncbi:Gp15 family bacteriophage protein [Anaerosacchariphilus polymeriproducens]|uniref:Bacteriophage Gp15 protein n=1 Tax=Anaerosacchariphilus polymeriproducens TaxID=1812858 RepID=A0A371AQT9_9FIRM|nr:Gp15 family bacteriophage protein [Anaerosacchariphilus polymeriproducens]RDU21941.1 hypothetical protein DWV06_15500 [Anaerosacchariphilus polymeriproducens]